MKNCPHCGVSIEVPTYSYYQYKWQHKGVRFFKKNNVTNEIWQLVVSSGQEKSGRPNQKGIYAIKYVSFISNYDTPVMRKYLTDITKKEWDDEVKSFLLSSGIASAEQFNKHTIQQDHGI